MIAMCSLDEAQKRVDGRLALCRQAIADVCKVHSTYTSVISVKTWENIGTALHIHRSESYTEVKGAESLVVTSPACFDTCLGTNHRTKASRSLRHTKQQREHKVHHKYNNNKKKTT